MGRVKFVSNNIYNIPSWAASTNYSRNDIVVNSNLYYYANSAHLSSSLFSTDLTNNKWLGYVTDRGEQKKYFTWLPAYNHPATNQPRVKKIQLGDGYFQLIPDGISNILPSYDLEFECDLNEASAILHFLENCNGTESFIWLPPLPRGIISRWTCSQWSDSQPFYNNYKIQARFDRSVV